MTTAANSAPDPGAVAFDRLVSLLLLLSTITLYVPEQIAHRTKRWSPRNGHR